MTEQEAFNEVWQWFVVEGHGRSISDEIQACQLRGDGGAKCAVGVLIPDEYYRPEWDGKGENQVIADPADIKMHVPRIAELDAMFLDRLQRAHDDAAYKDDFAGYIRENLEGLAERHGLQVPA